MKTMFYVIVSFKLLKRKEKEKEAVTSHFSNLFCLNLNPLQIKKKKTSLALSGHFPLFLINTPELLLRE